MCQFIRIFAFILTLLLTKNAFSQIIWTESFDIPEKGYSADSLGNGTSDIENVLWQLDVQNCTFSNQNDYVKTVSTFGGRFEALDCGGEAVWISELIGVADFFAVNISVETGETGSGNDSEKKYINAFCIVDNSDTLVFNQKSSVFGNWGEQTLETKSIKAQNVKVLLRMSSQYANDKVWADNVTIEAVEAADLEPAFIQIAQTELAAFVGDTINLQAKVLNANQQIITDSLFALDLSGDFAVLDFHYSAEGIYHWKILLNTSGYVHYSVFNNQNVVDAADSTVLVFENVQKIWTDDFENFLLSKWKTDQHWHRSDYYPIDGDFSMKHNEQTEGGESVLSTNDTLFMLNEKDYFFSFTLKNGDWDPSGSNSFYLRFTNDTNDGYAIGVNASGTSDLLSAWKIANGQVTQMLGNTLLDWDSGDVVKIDVLRKAYGQWSVCATNLNSLFSDCMGFYDSEINRLEKMSLVFNYSVTRSGQLWFDNFLISAKNSPPFIVDAYTVDLNTFVVKFNEPVISSTVSKSNISIKTGRQNSVNVVDIKALSDTEYTITTASVTDTVLEITAGQVRDIEGAVQEQTSFVFCNVLPPEPFDLLISEIMPDVNPAPPALPAYEYVEIYNRSDKNIQLQNMFLQVRDKLSAIPQKVIVPGQYLVMSNTDFTQEFIADNVIGLTGFPNLLVGGAYIALLSADSLIIDELIYSDQWHSNSEKSSGGFSLERIDTERFCNQPGNWVTSENIDGGTPGKENSVAGTNPDVDPPQLIGAKAISENEIEITFTESLDYTSAVNIAHYFIHHNEIDSVNYTSFTTELTLFINPGLQARTDYTLTVQNISDECGNVLDKATMPFSLQKLQAQDIVITEVLFDPFVGGVDFVELYNRSGFTIDLSELKFASRNNEYLLRSVYPIASKYFAFAPETYMAFTTSISSLEEFYSLPYADNVFELEKIPQYYSTEGNVVLLTDTATIIDEFAYSSDMHSQWLSSAKGVSLERLSIEQNTNHKSNWHSASGLYGYATPGYANSQVELSDESLQVEISTDEVTPNGDNYNDNIEIKFYLDKPGYMANVYVYNIHGMPIKRLVNNELIGNLNTIVYDVSNQSGNILPMGTYLLYIELLHLDNSHELFKFLFHVSDVR